MIDCTTCFGGTIVLYGTIDFRNTVHFHLNSIDDDIVLPIEMLNDVTYNDINGENRVQKQVFHPNSIGIQENVVSLPQIINNNSKMARPIKNTPALYGKDAKRFLAEISVLPSVEERKRERLRIKRSVNEFMSLVAQRQGKA